MGLRLPKPRLLLLLLLVSLLFLLRATSPTPAEARPLPNSPPHQQRQQQRIPDLFATLGMECKCCDGGECTSSWVEPCSDLQCRPWKLQ